MEMNPLGLAKFIILQPTLEPHGYSVSPEFEDLSLPTTLVEFSLPVLFQCHRQNCLSLLLVHDLQNFLFALLSYFRLLSTFNSGSLFKLWGIRHQWAYHDCYCPRRESSRASKDMGVSWLADSLSITVTERNCLGHADIPPNDASAQIRTETPLSQLLPPPVGLLGDHRFTDRNSRALFKSLSHI